jgi:hypothetical protein
MAQSGLDLALGADDEAAGVRDLIGIVAALSR